MYTRLAVKRLLENIKSNKVSLKKAYDILCELPYSDLGFAKLDNHRQLRKGFPEVIYCKGKTTRQIEGIISCLYKKTKTLLLTHAGKELFRRLKKIYPDLSYNKTAGMIYSGSLKPHSKKEVLIVTAGTADLPVAEQASVTLRLMGNRVSTLCDVGVAGVHRLLDNRARLLRSNVIIVIAGMEGALASVVSGLVSRPVIAVPTSVGYGASFRGIAPLLTMLNSCSPGVGVVNIDNGFGAGYLASLMNKS